MLQIKGVGQNFADSTKLWDKMLKNFTKEEEKIF